MKVFTLFAMLGAVVTAAPQSSYTQNNVLPIYYTLTAYLPSSNIFNALKVNWGGALNLFQAKVGSYCPFIGDQASLCPNGTETVFVGTLAPDSEVPGGQDLYVAKDGFITITVQHSHFIPTDAYAYGIGWTWYALPVGLPSMPNCPADTLHNCEAPTGYFNFKAPNATVGGVMACPNPYNANVTSLYAVTPAFNQTGCHKLIGLGTHNYTGPNPPVWAY